MNAAFLRKVNLPSAALLVCAGLWLGLIYQLSAQWSVYPQYRYGWAVPFLCIYLLRRRGVRLSRCPAPPHGGAKRTALLLLVLSCLLYAPTRWLHEANPIWRLTTAAWAIEVIGITLCAVFLLYGEAELRRWAWPAAFFLIAVPWPSGVETEIVQRLTRLNSSAAAEALGEMGIPCLSHGNVIETAAGTVGINEACSGLQSLQATLMLSFCLGEFYRLKTFGRSWCVLAGCLVAVLGNVGRTTFLAWVVARRGLPALEQWHGPTGVGILLGVFLTLWCLARWFPSTTNANERNAKDADAGRMSNKTSTLFGFGLAGVLACWVGLVEIETQTWYGAHERRVATQPDWRLKAHPRIPAFRWVELPGEILAQFRADEALEARWQQPSGVAGQIYYFRWLPARSLKRRVGTQLAKTHRPESCLPGLGMTLQCEREVATFRVHELILVLRHYLFLADGAPVHVFYGCYEDVSGSQRFAQQRDNARSRVAAALEGSRNSGQCWLEIALWGMHSNAEATAVMNEVLPRLIEVQHAGQGRG